MLHAVIHHKLDLDHPDAMGSEDALTSAVFGTLFAAGAWDTLLRWLAPDSAQRAVDPTTCHYWFWPRLSGCEPDVLIRLGDELILVEAKLASAKHDLTAKSHEPRIRDQLHREWLSLHAPASILAGYGPALDHACRSCSKRVVMVVDRRNWRRSTAELAESRALLPDHATLELTSWQHLHQLLRKPGEVFLATGWCGDLVRFLIACRLDSYAGFAGGLTNELATAALLKEWCVRDQRCMRFEPRWNKGMIEVAKMGPENMSRALATFWNAQRHPTRRVITL